MKKCNGSKLVKNKNNHNTYNHNSTKTQKEQCRRGKKTQEHLCLERVNNLITIPLQLKAKTD